MGGQQGLLLHQGHRGADWGGADTKHDRGWTRGEGHPLRLQTHDCQVEILFLPKLPRKDKCVCTKEGAGQSALEGGEQGGNSWEGGRSDELQADEFHSCLVATD